MQIHVFPGEVNTPTQQIRSAASSLGLRVPSLGSEEAMREPRCTLSMVSPLNPQTHQDTSGVRWKSIGTVNCPQVDLLDGP